MCSFFLDEIPATPSCICQKYVLNTAVYFCWTLLQRLASKLRAIEQVVDKINLAIKGAPPILPSEEEEEEGSQ
jgi:hypothetical protein